MVWFLARILLGFIGAGAMFAVLSLLSDKKRLSGQIRKVAVARWPEINADTTVVSVELLLDWTKVERRPEEGYCPGLDLLTAEVDGVGLVEIEENTFLIFSSKTDTLVVVEVKG